MSMSGGGKGVTSEINITPLIDVVLVLLIIFMVITPMLQKGKPVQLPAAMDPGKQAESEDDLLISMQFNEQNADKPVIFLKDEQVTHETLLAQLKEEHERDSSTPIYLKADKRLRYSAVKELMVLCNDAGYTGVGLVAEQKQLQE